MVRMKACKGVYFKKVGNALTVIPDINPATILTFDGIPCTKGKFFTFNGVFGRSRQVYYPFLTFLFINV
jgi:hypothetical protein